MSAFELVVMIFSDQPGAGEALAWLGRLKKKGTVRGFHAALLVKDRQGLASYHEPDDVDAKMGAVVGAVGGALVGLLGGPAGAIAGALAGAATGGAAAAKMDLGFSNDFLNEAKNALQPDSSAVVVMVEQDWTEQLISELERFEGKLLRQVLKADLIERLRQAGGE